MSYTSFQLEYKVGAASQAKGPLAKDSSVVGIFTTPEVLSDKAGYGGYVSVVQDKMTSGRKQMCVSEVGAEDFTPNADKTNVDDGFSPNVSFGDTSKPASGRNKAKPSSTLILKPKTTYYVNLRTVDVDADFLMTLQAR